MAIVQVNACGFCDGTGRVVQEMQGEAWGAEDMPSSIPMIYACVMCSGTGEKPPKRKPRTETLLAVVDGHKEDSA